MEHSEVSFWKPIFEKGSQYFDIANIHSFPYSDVAAKAELIVSEFKKLLSKYRIDKPIWVTEVQYVMRATRAKIFESKHISPEEHSRILVKSYVISFA